MAKSTDFRYNTGETRVPWAAVGENYNKEDLMAVIRFLMKGEGEEYENAIKAVEAQVEKLDKLSSPPGKLSLGPQVEAAEKACDEYLKTSNSVFVANATAGFEIAYKYANLQAGDEVIVPAITFIATIAYPLSVGAKLVFADLDERTCNMDPKDVERKITDKTKMIVPVHIGGYPCDMDAIMEIAEKHNVLVLEDAAHAFGAIYKGKMVGTIFGCNFDTPIKNWLYDVNAMPGKYGPFVALNSSTTEIQALGLKLQVERYDKILAERKAAAEYVTKRLSANPAIIPQITDNKEVTPTYHLYLLEIDPQKAGGNVQTLKNKLTEKGVTNIPHFGPLFHFDILKTFGYDMDEIAKTCPVCEELFNNRFTHLPIYGLSAEQLEYMCDAILESVEEMQAGK